MTTTRILLLGLPRMLREILEEAVAGEPRMAIVGHGTEGPVLSVAQEHDVGCVIADVTAVPDAELERLLQRRPGTFVLTVDGDGRAATVCEMRPFHMALGEASPERILQAIRERAPQGATAR